MTPESLELIGMAVGTLLTILVLSYLFGDNPLYRIALHILVGASVGYGLAIVLTTVFLKMVIPSLLAEIGTVERLSIVVPLFLGMLLLFKGFPRSRLVAVGNLSTAFLIGVGAAVATGGALLGTIVPQAVASGSLFDWLRMGGLSLINGAVIVGGTICALLAFAFTVPRSPTMRGLWNRTIGVIGNVGRGFLAIAFGAAFAAALTASISILISRLYTVIQFILPYLQGGQ